MIERTENEQSLHQSCSHAYTNIWDQYNPVTGYLVLVLSGMMDKIQFH